MLGMFYGKLSSAITLAYRCCFFLIIAIICLCYESTTMSTTINSKIVGAFHGFHGGAVFRLTNGQAWQQKRYEYKYRYKFRPSVQIVSDGNAHMLYLDCMDEPIAVVRVSIVEEGTIVSEFNGFSDEARFEFESGRVWVPAEYKYHYHYAHRPHGIIVSGINGSQLSVEGMNETLRVQQV